MQEKLYYKKERKEEKDLVFVFMGERLFKIKIIHNKYDILKKI
jgi:hypothetical protein